MEGRLLYFAGRGIGLALDGLVTCRVSTMRAGEAREGFVLDAEGTVIDTVRIEFAGRTVDASRRIDKDEFRVFCHDAKRVGEYFRLAFEGVAEIDPAFPEARAKCECIIQQATADAEENVRQVSIDSAEAAELVDITKPFFVGQHAIRQRFETRALPDWRAPRIERPRPLGKTLLGAEHERIGVAQWGPFGSAMMPIQYAGGAGAIAAEHLATRCGAALYDVSHMLPVIIKGRDARAFLEMCLVNSVGRLGVGRCQYQAICLPDGTPQDDLYLNYLEHDAATGEDAFLLVGNSGHEADYDYLKAVAAGAVGIDPEMAFKRFEGDVRFVSRLEDTEAKGKWSKPLYSVSLQGPKSREILMSAVRSGDRERIAGLRFNGLATDVRLASKDGVAVVTFTGYCGEPVGYEVYTEGEHLADLWRRLYSGGATPAGLGARDSTRQEAGLPLFGHEIDGELDVPLTGGRYPKIVAFQKPFFLGRKGALEAERRRTKRVFLLAGEGPRKVPAGWPVYDEKGALLGNVTSTSTIRPGKTDVTQGYLEEKSVRSGDRVIVTSPSRMPRAGEAPEGRAFRVTTWDKAGDYDGGGGAC